MDKRRRASRRRKAGGAGNGKRVTYVLFALAVVLLIGSTIGSTRAALTYYSENYTAEITVSQIGVTLLENGKLVSSRDYDNVDWNIQTNRGRNDTARGALLQNMLGKDEKLVLNKTYSEKLSVKNSGTIDEYVRVRVYRYWTKKNDSGQDVKITSLSPDLIDLNLVNGDKWVKSPHESAECMELYYKGILPAGGETELFADGIRIDGEVAGEAIVETKGDTITTTYKYNGVEFHVDVEVDAVQTHNAQDAIKSAWGVDAASLGIL